VCTATPTTLKTAAVSHMFPDFILLVFCCCLTAIVPTFYCCILAVFIDPSAHPSAHNSRNYPSPPLSATPTQWTRMHLYVCTYVSSYLSALGVPWVGFTCVFAVFHTHFCKFVIYSYFSALCGRRKRKWRKYQVSDPERI